MGEQQKMNYFSIWGEQKIPQIGLGTFDLKEESIRSGIEIGYRLIDTAWQYGNEKEVGNAVRTCSIPREDIFVTTKLWTEHVRTNSTRNALEESLRNLQLEYIDLYLIHWPAEGYEKAWETMIQLKEEGKIKNIGVSNFTEEQLKNLESYGVKPVLNQIESHPYFRNDDLIQECEKRGILAQVWCPLGGSYSNLKANQVFERLSEKYGKTPAQIILRWHIQRKVLLIPRSKNYQRLKENVEVFDFQLEKEDMRKIDELETGKRMGADPKNFNF